MAGELVVGVGQDLEQRGRGPGQRPDHHAREHQDEGPVARAHRGCDEAHQRHRAEPAREAHQLDRGDRQRQEDPQDRAEPGPRRDPEDVGRDERVAEQRLVARTGGRQRGADEKGGRDPRESNRQQHGFRLRRGPAVAGAAGQDRQGLARPQGIGSDQERPEGAGSHRADEPERRSGSRNPRPPRGQGARPFAHSSNRSSSASPRSTWYQSR